MPSRSQLKLSAEFEREMSRFPEDRAIGFEVSKRRRFVNPVAKLILPCCLRRPRTIDGEDLRPQRATPTTARRSPFDGYQVEEGVTLSKSSPSEVNFPPTLYGEDGLQEHLQATHTFHVPRGYHVGEKVPTVEGSKACVITAKNWSDLAGSGAKLPPSAVAKNTKSSKSGRKATTLDKIPKPNGVSEPKHHSALGNIEATSPGKDSTTRIRKWLRGFSKKGKAKLLQGSQQPSGSTEQGAEENGCIQHSSGHISSDSEHLSSTGSSAVTENFEEYISLGETNDEASDSNVDQERRTCGDGRRGARPRNEKVGTVRDEDNNVRSLPSDNLGSDQDPACSSVEYTATNGAKVRLIQVQPTRQTGDVSELEFRCVGPPLKPKGPRIMGARGPTLIKEGHVEKGLPGPALQRGVGPASQQRDPSGESGRKEGDEVLEREREYAAQRKRNTEILGKIRERSKRLGSRVPETPTARHTQPSPRHDPANESTFPPAINEAIALEAQRGKELYEETCRNTQLMMARLHQNGGFAAFLPSIRARRQQPDVFDYFDKMVESNERFDEHIQNGMISNHNAFMEMKRRKGMMLAISHPPGHDENSRHKASKERRKHGKHHHRERKSQEIRVVKDREKFIKFCWPHPKDTIKTIQMAKRLTKKKTKDGKIKKNAVQSTTQPFHPSQLSDEPLDYEYRTKLQQAKNLKMCPGSTDQRVLKDDDRGVELPSGTVDRENNPGTNTKPTPANPLVWAYETLSDPRRRKPRLKNIQRMMGARNQRTRVKAIKSQRPGPDEMVDFTNEEEHAF